MPEGIERGYQPSAEELKLGQDHLESMGVTEQELHQKTQDGKDITGIRHADQYGRVIFERQEYEDGGKQAIELIYHQDGGVTERGTEQGKFIEGGKTGKELTREHPMSQVMLDLQWFDPDMEEVVREPMAAILESVGHTPKGAATKETWAHFEINDADALIPFTGLIPESGRNCFVLRSTPERPISGSIDANVNGRTIHFPPLSKLSIDMTPDRRPIKATGHVYGWTEVPKPETVAAE